MVGGVVRQRQQRGRNEGTDHHIFTHAACTLWQQALGLAIEVECLARQYIAASTMGSPVLLDDAEMDIILAKFRTYGKQPDELRAMGAFDVAHAVHRLAQSYYLGVLAR